MIADVEITKYPVRLVYNMDSYYKDIESGKHGIEELKMLIMRDIQMVIEPLDSNIICFNFDGGFGFPTAFVKEVAQAVARSCPLYLIDSVFMIRSTEDETIPDLFKKYMIEYYHSINEVKFYGD